MSITEDFLEILLLIPIIWSENKFESFYTCRDVLWPKVRSVLINVSCARGKNLSSGLVEWNVL